MFQAFLPKYISNKAISWIINCLIQNLKRVIKFIFLVHNFFMLENGKLCWLGELSSSVANATRPFIHFVFDIPTTCHQLFWAVLIISQSLRSLYGKLLNLILDWDMKYHLYKLKRWKKKKEKKKLLQATPSNSTSEFSEMLISNRGPHKIGDPWIWFAGFTKFRVAAPHGMSFFWNILWIWKFRPVWQWHRLYLFRQIYFLAKSWWTRKLRLISSLYKDTNIRYRGESSLRKFANFPSSPQKFLLTENM